MRLTSLLSLLLVLAACDTGGPTADPLSAADLVGEWDLVSSDEITYVTVTASQDIPDLSKPATSMLTISGEHQGAVSNVWDYVYKPYDPAANEPRTAKLQARDVPFSMPGYQSLIEVSGGPGPNEFEVDIVVDVGGTEGAWYTSSLSGSNAISFDRLGVTVDNVTATPHRNASGTVTLDGRFEFATRRVEAGETLSVRTFFASLVDDDVETVTFAEDGTYRLALPTSDGIDYQTGTWEIDGESVRLTADGGGSALYEVERSASGLRLFREREAQLSPFRGFVHDRLYLEPGTTSDIREESIIVLSR